MDSSTTRMGSQTLGYSAPRTSAPAAYRTSPAMPDPTFWGSLPKGIKTIIKVAVVTVLVYAAASFAMPYLITNVPAVASIAGSLSSTIAGIGEALTIGIDSALAFFNAAPLGFPILTAAETATASTAASAVAAGAAGVAATVSTPKTAALTVASTPITPPPPAAPLVVTDISAQTAQIDPSSSILSQKPLPSGMGAHGHNAPTVDLPDSLAAQHSHQGDHGKSAKLGHLAEEVHETRKQNAERTAQAAQRNNLSQIEQKITSWQQRMGGETAAKSKATHAESVPRRESSFAASIDQDRQKLENALSV